MILCFYFICLFIGEYNYIYLYLYWCVYIFIYLIFWAFLVCVFIYIYFIYCIYLLFYFIYLLYLFIILFTLFINLIYFICLASCIYFICFEVCQSVCGGVVVFGEVLDLIRWISRKHHIPLNSKENVMEIWPDYLFVWFTQKWENHMHWFAQMFLLQDETFQWGDQESHTDHGWAGRPT